ncbi:MAG: hypothetical protein K0S67_1745 [Nitrososphaeraceae archaeon]|jgi:hypothetical protein|nr:hypothetical protein [Nitrososphaeraceae archaeon]
MAILALVDKKNKELNKKYEIYIYIYIYINKQKTKFKENNRSTKNHFKSFDKLVQTIIATLLFEGNSSTDIEIKDYAKEILNGH